MSQNLCLLEAFTAQGAKKTKTVSNRKNTKATKTETLNMRFRPRRLLLKNLSLWPLCSSCESQRSKFVRPQHGLRPKMRRGNLILRRLGSSAPQKGDQHPERRGVAFRVAGRAQVGAYERCCSAVWIDATPLGPNAHTTRRNLNISTSFHAHREPQMNGRFGRLCHSPCRFPRPQRSNAAPLRMAQNVLGH